MVGSLLGTTVACVMNHSRPSRRTRLPWQVKGVYEEIVGWFLCAISNWPYHDDIYYALVGHVVGTVKWRIAMRYPSRLWAKAQASFPGPEPQRHGDIT